MMQLESQRVLTVPAKVSGIFLIIEATVHAHDTVTGKTANFDGNYTNPPVAIRLAISAFTSGSITLRIVQSGSGS